MNSTVVGIAIVVGLIVLGLAMLWFLGWCFKTAVDADGKIESGFFVLVVVAVIAGYGWLISFAFNST